VWRTDGQTELRWVRCALAAVARKNFFSAFVVVFIFSAFLCVLGVQSLCCKYQMSNVKSEFIEHILVKKPFNAVDAVVLGEQECLYWLSESVGRTFWILTVIGQWLPDSRLATENARWPHVLRRWNVAHGLESHVCSECKRCWKMVSGTGPSDIEELGDAGIGTSAYPACTWLGLGCQKV